MLLANVELVDEINYQNYNIHVLLKKKAWLISLTLKMRIAVKPIIKF